MMDAFICDAIRTPIGRFGGALSSIRADDLAALSIKELKERNKSIDWSMVDEVIFGCANQSGEDNRNIARMSLLLAGLPQTVPGITINRLCASGLEAVTYASRMIKSNEAHLIIAGGVERMSRAPFVIPKSTTPFSRNAEIYDTTIGWRFINPIMRQMYGVDSMPETAENVAERWNISREDQDKFAYWSQKKAAEAISKGRFDTEIFKVKIIQKKEEKFLDRDEHPRFNLKISDLEKLKSGVQIKFSDFLELIEQEYTFSNIVFTNNGLTNSKDENQGSAKVFCFGLMHSLDEKDVIRCFGEHYKSVLESPEDLTSHLNIRNFMKMGWEGVSIDETALSVK